MRVVLGNRNAVHTVNTVKDGEIVQAPEDLKGKRATEVDIPDDTAFANALATIIHPTEGVWAKHTGWVKGENPTPAWVASDSPLMAQVLADHYGGIEVRELDVNPTRKRGGGGASAAASTTLLLGFLLYMLVRAQPFLKTNAGNDFQAKQMGGAASATAVAKWVAVTANSTAPSAASTTLTGEITTGGGGLVRATGTYAHTTGAASYTITITFTANGSDSLPVTLAKFGIFDAASSGNLVFETLLSATATLSASGDSMTLTQTVTL